MTALSAGRLWTRIRRRRLAGSRTLDRIVLAAIVAAAAGSLATAEVLPPGLKIERVLDASARTGDLAQSPTGELWIVERTTGVVRVVDAGAERATLTLAVLTDCDAGLLDVAFDPEYRVTGRAFVSYVATTGQLEVRSLALAGNALTPGPVLVSAGRTATGCRPGGGLAVGDDGKLYVGVGDLDVGSRAQSDRSLAGKILRVELDGSIPSDNPDPRSPVWAKGFRDIDDMTFVDGFLAVSDRGGEHDEVGLVGAGDNHGWNVVSGDSGGVFDDPSFAFGPSVAAEGLAFDGVALLQTRGGGAIHRLTDNDRTLFDPAGDADGTADAACPDGIHALAAAGDGMLYAVSDGTNAGIWRVWADAPGPRQVSPPGSPFPLTVNRTASALEIGWEDLGALDAGRPERNGGQHAGVYTVWQGTLPIHRGPEGAYDHSAIAHGDGTAAGTARRTMLVPVPDGSHYFLTTAQGDNLEGVAGAASDGEQRHPATDYCVARGTGRFTGQCIDDFRSPLTGDPTTLVDWNPFSATFGQALSVRDFRGSVVHLDISADNCFWCNLQAPTYPEVDAAYRGRDFALLTVLTLNLLGPKVIPPDACEAVIANWATRHGQSNPVLCDVDVDGDGLGDVSRQFWHFASDPEGCGGTPQNFFIDQGGVIFDFVCSFAPGSEVATRIEPEVNPETCE